MTDRTPALIGLGLAALGLMALASAKPQPAAEDFSLDESTSFDQLCELAQKMYAEGRTLNSGTLAIALLSATFPGQDWAAPAGDAMLAAVQRTTALAATIFDDESVCASIFPAATLGQQAAAQFASLTRATPTPGAFYAVRPGDTPGSIVTAAATAGGAALTPTNLYTYGQCLASGGGWNARLYLRPSDPVANPNDPNIYTQILAGGTTQNIYLAFAEANDGSVAAVEQGRFPQTNTDFPGESPFDGGPRGVLWLPPVSLTEGDSILDCGQMVWSDGTSSLDPPPEFLDLLNAAAMMNIDPSAFPSSTL